jgi:DNA-3-methyladenine glycosylase II
VTATWRTFLCDNRQRRSYRKEEHIPAFQLTPSSLAEGLAYLSALDADLAQIHARLGAPPMWAREPGFPTLVYIILEQQVSLASAKAAFTKLEQAASPLTPQALLRFSDDELKAIGFSRQKAGYCRGLARAVMDGELDLDALADLPDDEVRAALLKQKGIGPWTANIYLLMVLLRPDVWPTGDLALALAYQKLKRLPNRLGTEELAVLAEGWQPWRAVAARLLWHHYLNPPAQI